jgi:hypothetical protein
VRDGAETTGDGTTADLIRRLGHQLSTLLHQEIALAKAELTEKVRATGTGAGVGAGAGMLGFLGIAALVGAAVAGLANVVAVWLAALIVGVALVVLAGALGLVAVARIREGAPPIPTEALEQTKEDIEWLTTRARSARQSTTPEAR